MDWLEYEEQKQKLLKNMSCLTKEQYEDLIKNLVEKLEALIESKEMTLQEYMRLRMGECKINALSRQECLIFGIEQVKGWFINNKFMKITPQMLQKLKNNPYATKRKNRGGSIKPTPHSTTF